MAHYTCTYTIDTYICLHNTYVYIQFKNDKECFVSTDVIYQRSHRYSFSEYKSLHNFY